MVNDLEKQECMDGIMVTTFNLALLWVPSLRILNQDDREQRNCRSHILPPSYERLFPQGTLLGAGAQVGKAEGRYFWVAHEPPADAASISF